MVFVSLSCSTHLQALTLSPALVTASSLISDVMSTSRDKLGGIADVSVIIGRYGLHGSARCPADRVSRLCP